MTCIGWYLALSAVVMVLRIILAPYEPPEDKV